MVKKTEFNEQKAMESLKKSPAYRLAYEDSDFLNSYHARPARLQLELLKTEIGLEQHNIKSTIVVFGSARIYDSAKAGKIVKELKLKLSKEPGDAGLEKRLRIAESVLEKSKYYDQAVEFSRLVSSECQVMEHSEYVIITGGGPGIMEAANRGAFEIGAKSIGLNITLPHEQEPNPYITPDLCFRFHYFAIRKMHFMLRAKALVAFPGGFGTLDELFEAITLVQTRIIKPLPIVLIGKKFWKKLIDFEFLVEQGTISEKDLNLFVYVDSAREAWDYIKNYHG